jgi:methylenetetrahydrofolate dehydrogenase (NADP+)/methenyltetrahydrofolate cyclohydrolase
LRDEIASLKSRGATPGLAVVLVGDDPASRAYVRAKDKMCRELGLHSVKLELPATTTQEELLARVDELNRDEKIHGILVQSPPPPQIDEAAILRALDPRKDVDGFHPLNVAKLALDDDTGFVPCTPLGCLRLLQRNRRRPLRRQRRRARSQHDRRKANGAFAHAKRHRRNRHGHPFPHQEYC